MSVPEQVGVYGGGRMGAGIAHAFLVAGAGVTIVETDEEAGRAAVGRVRASLLRGEERGTLTEPAGGLVARLVVTTTAQQLAACALVVEAVPEQVPLKQEVLRRIEQVAPEAAVATNTSSLSVDLLASVLDRPQQLLGLHFFNPAPASSLVEIVVGAATTSELVGSAQAWVAALGKVAITVTNSPGFASSRPGVAIALEAMRMVEEAVASVEDIDTTMILGYRHPTGPLRTTDIVGLDVRLAIAEHLERDLGARFAPPAILRAKVGAGHLGRKAGRGFYTW